MKYSFIAVLAALALAGSACSQMQIEPISQIPISRDKLVQKLNPILKLEKRLDQIMYYTRVLGSLGGMSQDKSTELKEHLNIYYPYYLASNVQLAKGNIVSYEAHLKLANEELDAMEAIIKEGLLDEELDFDSVPGHQSQPGKKTTL